MTLETIPKQENSAESAPSPIDAIKARDAEVRRKIDAQIQSINTTINTLPSGEQEVLRKEADSFFTKARNKLSIAASAATLAFAMNSTAKAEEQPEVPTSAKEAIESVEQANIVIDAAKLIVETTLVAKKSQLKKDIEALTDEATDTQKKLDSALSLATDTPLIGKVIERKTPLGILSALNELQKDLRNPKKSTKDTLKSLGRALLDLKTFGIGTFILDQLSSEKNEKEGGKTDEKENP